MVLRAEAIRARLLKLEEVIGRLRSLREQPSQEIGPDLGTDWAVERGLQLGAEILFDVGNHVLSAHFGTAAADYEDILAQLGQRGVIDASVAARLRGLGGFRNLLVHAYLDLDPVKVLEHLERAPDDFDAFSRALRNWLSTQDLAG